MSNLQRYFQCRLQRGDSETTGWIEERGAKLGAEIELLPSGEIWTVAKVFTHGLEVDHMKELQRLHRHSLPSVEGMH